MTRSSRAGLRHWWRRVKREGKRSPLAAIGVVAALVALVGLVPLASQVVDYFESDEISIHGVPLPADQISKAEAPRSSSTRESREHSVSSGVPSAGAPDPSFEKVVGQLTSPTFIIPRQLDDIPRPPDTARTGSAAFAEWAREMGGVYASEVGVAFTVQGKSQNMSLLTGIDIEVVDRHEPLGGTWIAPDGAGGEPNRLLVVDLDQSPPAATFGGLEEWSFPLSVSSQDLELFSIVAGTESCYCGWIARLHWIDPDGDERESAIDDDGEPFRVTGTRNASTKVFAPRTPADPWPR